MTRIEALKIAKDAAKAHQPSYYAEPFEPHEWVICAILMAAQESDEVGQSDSCTAGHRIP